MDRESKIEFMLEQWPLEELLEMMDITRSRVLEILLDGGHVVLPPFMEDVEVGDETNEMA